MSTTHTTEVDPTATLTTPAGPGTPAAALRPGRMETDRLATRIAVAEGRERKSITSPLTGEVIGDRTVVREGLAAGDTVVVAGAFAVKSQMLKAQLGEGHGH